MQNIVEDASDLARGVIVVLGTGGTIAGEASIGDDLAYRAASRSVDELVEPLRSDGVVFESEQVAQLDSKDMDFATWRVLALRIEHHLRRSEVRGVVVTRGTDTLEETAYFLSRVLAPSKPVVLTAAMRPATSRQADGPQNLHDAVAVVRTKGSSGVLVAIGGDVHGAHDVRKVHPFRLAAFGSGDAGVIGHMEAGRLRRLRDWLDRAAARLGVQRLPADPAAWPVVDIVTSHVGARAESVEALCRAGAVGLVVAATGNGTVHHVLEKALLDAQARGVAVLRSTRCLDGAIVDSTVDREVSSELPSDVDRTLDGAFSSDVDRAVGSEVEGEVDGSFEAAEAGGGGRLRSAADLTPVKARIELIQQLLSASARVDRTRS